MANRCCIPFSQMLRMIAGYFFGILFTLIGLLNCFWGNDPFFGLFLIGTSLIYYPPAASIYQRLFHRRIPAVMLILIALFLLWASLGVGELFPKIALMRKSFQ